jgi:hypothetical protein
MRERAELSGGAFTIESIAGPASWAMEALRVSFLEPSIKESVSTRHPTQISKPEEIAFSQKLTHFILQIC